MYLFQPRLRKREEAWEREKGGLVPRLTLQGAARHRETRTAETAGEQQQCMVSDDCLGFVAALLAIQLPQCASMYYSQTILCRKRVRLGLVW